MKFPLIWCAVLSAFCGSALASTISFTETWTGAETSGPNRIFRNGVVSVAGTAKPFPGIVANNPTYFATFAFTALAGTTVTITPTTEDIFSFLALYDSTFTALSLSTGYLGDQGSSNLTNTFSVTAPGGQLFVVAGSLSGASAIGHTVAENVDFTAVPEPTAVSLIGLGLIGVLVRRRTMKRAL